MYLPQPDTKAISKLISRIHPRGYSFVSSVANITFIVVSTVIKHHFELFLKLGSNKEYFGVTTIIYQCIVIDYGLFTLYQLFTFNIYPLRNISLIQNIMERPNVCVSCRSLSSTD